ERARIDLAAVRHQQLIGRDGDVAAAVAIHARKENPVVPTAPPSTAMRGAVSVTVPAAPEPRLADDTWLSSPYTERPVISIDSSPVIVTLPASRPGRLSMRKRGMLELSTNAPFRIRMRSPVSSTGPALPPPIVVFDTNAALVIVMSGASSVTDPALPPPPNVAAEMIVPSHAPGVRAPTSVKRGSPSPSRTIESKAVTSIVPALPAPPGAYAVI